MMLRRSMLVLSFATCVTLMAPIAQAQNIKNPSAVAFESADHAKVTGYEVDIVSSGGAVVQTQQGGKGTQDAAGVVTVAFSVQSLAFGTYTVRVRAIVTSGSTTLKSVDSTPSPTWDRVPMQPVKVTIK
jgi:hypothetical protein